MKGAVIAVGRLLSRLEFPLTLDYGHATRCRGTTSGEDLQWLHRPAASVHGRQVLVENDILDAGVTLDAVVRACRENGAANVHTAVLVEKTREHTHDFKADFVGVQFPDRYLFGCGLDYLGYFRNVDGIYAVADEDV